MNWQEASVIISSIAAFGMLVWVVVQHQLSKKAEGRRDISDMGKKIDVVSQDLKNHISDEKSYDSRMQELQGEANVLKKEIEDIRRDQHEMKEAQKEIFADIKQLGIRFDDKISKIYDKILEWMTAGDDV